VTLVVGDADNSSSMILGDAGQFQDLAAKAHRFRPAAERKSGDEAQLIRLELGGRAEVGVARAARPGPSLQRRRRPTG